MTEIYSNYELNMSKEVFLDISGHIIGFIQLYLTQQHTVVIIGGKSAKERQCWIRLSATGRAERAQVLPRSGSGLANPKPIQMLDTLNLENKLQL